MLPRQDKKFAHPGEASGHTGKRESENPHACSVTPLSLFRVDQFLCRPWDNSLNRQIKTNPHRTPDLFKLAPFLPPVRRTKRDVSFHTPCTFDADRSADLIFQTPPIIELLYRKARVQALQIAITRERGITRNAPSLLDFWMCTGASLPLWLCVAARALLAKADGDAWHPTCAACCGCRQ